MSKIRSFLLQEIFPGFYAYYVNKKINKIYNELHTFCVDITEITQGKENDYIEQIKADLKEQYDIKKIIEDKAKSFLFIISLLITIIIFVWTYLLNSNTFYNIVALFFFGISIFYFLLGIIKSIKTINPKKFYIIQSDVKIDNDKKKIKLSANQSKDDFLKDLIKSKQLNDLIINILSNNAYASLILIRNGIICFVIFFVMSIF